MGGFSLRVALIVSATGRVFFRPREDLGRVGKRLTGGLVLTMLDPCEPLAGSQCFRPPSFLWVKERWCRDADNESLHAGQRRFGISVAFDLRLIDQSK